MRRRKETSEKVATLIPLTLAVTTHCWEKLMLISQVSSSSISPRPLYNKPMLCCSCSSSVWEKQAKASYNLQKILWFGDRVSPGGTLHEAWSQVSQVSNTGFLVIFQKGISTRFTSVKVSPYHSILILSLFSMNFHGLKSVWKDVWINCQYWSTRHVQSFCWNSA